MTALEKRGFSTPMFVCQSQLSHIAYHWILAYLGLDVWANMHLNVRASSPNDMGCTQASIPARTFFFAEGESGYMAVLHMSCSLNF